MTQTQRPSAPIPKTYDPKAVEERLYRFWMDGGFFTPKIEPGKRPFVIIMPPPNVTGELHVGHALTAAIQDALVRWHRMRGDPALWLPGTDHAGIATQVVVERELAKEGVTRHQIGREQFQARVWDWVRKYGKRITEQHRALGASCDWSRERFTMDPGPSRAVRTTFVNLYKKGLIYRGERLINWCPRCRTALSDLETEHQDVQGHLWHMRYPYADGSGHVTVATTRPETYVGDTAVAVNPKDPRFTGLVGRKVKLPVIGREIPIVADDAISMEFGVGALKVTPGHDPVDFEIGARHGLEIINVMNLDATLNERGGPFAGMDRFKAREAIVKEFERLGLLEKIEPHKHAVGHCQRCKTIVEPLVSKQWFVKVGSHEEPDSIAGRAYRAVVDGRIAIVPVRFAKVYLNWMENIRDWCISRQLWWGHRIPVWYCQESACGHLTVALEDPAACERCGSKRIVQDSDVLDTWFSSALWTHSTLGWPDDTADLRYFYPSSVMETGYDILFFWVARMIMMGLENTGQVPFHTVFLHGLIRDELGQKMSKTKGNVVDPLETAGQYGTDALRFALTTGTSPGNDARLTPIKLENARNFANKIWNASRFVLTAADQATGFTPLSASERGRPQAGGEVTLEDRWVLSRLHHTIDEVSRMLEAFQIGEAQRAIYEFLWNDYCDWYIELAKIRLRPGAAHPGSDRGVPPERDASAQSPLPVLVHVLEQTMRLLHPFMPYVTEEVWQVIVQRLPDDPTRPASIMVAPYPAADPARYDLDAERRMGLTIEIITAIRNARAELKVDPAKQVEAIVDAAEHRELVLAQRAAIETLARANPLRVYGNGQPAPAFEKARVAVLGTVRVIVPTAGLVDVESERRKATDEIAQIERSIGQIDARLASPEFTSKAPPAVVEKERARLADYREKLAKLRERLKELG